MTELKPILGKEIWEKIEGAQGYAYISDSICDMDDEAALKIANGSLEQHRKCVKILQKIIKQYGIKTNIYRELRRRCG